MRSQTFRLGTFALFAGALALQSHWVSAQSGTTNYPNKTVKMIVPLDPELILLGGLWLKI